MRRLPAFLLLLWIWLGQAGAACAAVRLAPGNVSLPLAGHALVLEDPTGTMSLADVKRRGADFRPVPDIGGGAINFGYTPSVWWLRLDFEAQPAVPREWLLEVAFPTLDSVEYFGPGGEHLRAGDRLPFAMRPVAHRNFVFPVGLGEAGTASAWLRIASEGAVTVPLHLWRAEAFWRESQTAYAALSVYFGMLLALALYNLLLWFSWRDQNHLTYVLFVAAMAAGQLSLNGLGNEFLWPDWPDAGHSALVIGFAAAGLFGALFTRGFLETRRTLPRLDGAAIGLAAMFALSMVMALAAPYRLAAILTSLTGAAFSVVAVLAGLRCWRAGQHGAPTFLLAWSVLLVGVAVAGLRNLALIPTNFFSLYALQIGSALETLLLSFALADRIHGLQRDKDFAQSEALATRRLLEAALQRSQATLERRVAERTEELEAANARLRENERQLQALAHTDALTGLANRLLFDARLLQSMQHARRSPGRIALLLGDLDHFKAINDNYGHAIGDEVLRVAAGRLRATVREVDTVARLGDDRFAIVLTGLGSGADAEQMAKKLVANLGQPMRVLGLPLEVSISFGVALFPGGNLSSADLMRRAEQAMATAKQAGRACYRVY